MLHPSGKKSAFCVLNQVLDDRRLRSRERAKEFRGHAPVVHESKPYRTRRAGHDAPDLNRVEGGGVERLKLLEQVFVCIAVRLPVDSPLRTLPCICRASDPGCVPGRIRLDRSLRP